MDTEMLGGMTTLTPEGLAEMQEQPYLLRARGGVWTKVPAEKNRLPHDPQGHVQCVNTALAPDGTIYVNQMTLVCKSTDGGRTWTSFPHQEGMAGSLVILEDGTFLSVTTSPGRRPAKVWISQDKGRSWQTFSQINIPNQYHIRSLYTLFSLPDGTLLCGISCSNVESAGGDWARYVSGESKLLAFRSTDRGRTWEEPSPICDWGHEGGIVRTASGKLLAAIRYQRPLLPDDPPDLLEQTGASVFGSPFPYKHVFLADSEDEGRSWQNFRQLTTVFGQCYGFPAALSDGTVVVLHDHRYPRGLPGRAMVSYDEGTTWEDEVYLVYHGAVLSGYSESVTLEDDTILTIAGTTDNPAADQVWEGATGRSDLTAIRWIPEKAG